MRPHVESPTRGIEHANITRYRTMIHAFNASDLATALQLTDTSVRYHVPGRSPLAGEFRGIEAFQRMLRHARDLSRGTLEFHPSAVLADDQFLTAFGRIYAERQGRRLDNDQCVIFRFGNDKVVEGWTIPADLYAFDAFWS